VSNSAVSSIEDLIRDHLEDSQFLVSPSLTTNPDRPTFFVYAPKGLASVVSTVRLLEGATIVQPSSAAEATEVARLNVSGVSVSLSELYSPWVAFLFPPL
jgi:hypothetical protein